MQTLDPPLWRVETSFPAELSRTTDAWSFLGGRTMSGQPITDIFALGRMQIPDDLELLPPCPTRRWSRMRSRRKVRVCGVHVRYRVSSAQLPISYSCNSRAESGHLLRACTGRPHRSACKVAVVQSIADMVRLCEEDNVAIRSGSNYLRCVYTGC